MTRGQRVAERPPRRGGVVLAVGAILACVAALAIWQVASGDDTSTAASDGSGDETVGSEDPTSGATAEPEETTESEATTAASTGDDDSACIAEAGAAQRVVRATEIGIGHWDRHVQASIDWIAGRISEERKKEIWAATRLAGPMDLERYDAALAAYNETEGACAALESGVNDDCRERLTALEARMAAGAKSMGDWESHQEAMAAFAAGEFGAAHANMLWDKAKQTAGMNIKAFEQTASSVTRAPACS